MCECKSSEIIKSLSLKKPPSRQYLFSSPTERILPKARSTSFTTSVASKDSKIRDSRDEKNLVVKPRRLQQDEDFDAPMANIFHSTYPRNNVAHFLSADCEPKKLVKLVLVKPHGGLIRWCTRQPASLRTNLFSIE